MVDPDSPRSRDGADIMDGGIGNDIMLGDNGTITPFIDHKAAYDAAVVRCQRQRADWAMAATEAAMAAAM